MPGLKRSSAPSKIFQTYTKKAKTEDISSSDSNASIEISKSSEDVPSVTVPVKPGPKSVVKAPQPNHLDQWK